MNISGMVRHINIYQLKNAISDRYMYVLQLPTVREYIQNIFATIFNSLKYKKKTKPIVNYALDVR